MAETLTPPVNVHKKKRFFQYFSYLGRVGSMAESPKVYVDGYFFSLRGLLGSLAYRPHLGSPIDLQLPP